ncbi:acetate kinase [Lactobacillus sp. W8089]|nr:acetate kinase [Lactobacillus sp. W8086]MBI0108568.1 acetate kinase [Lactobacillus sp. W8085]MBI0111786.1 acetate kinase [Lactobacillus sp. W8088]MBI0115501.1 acetate kinase [Lactobacillus sp. W8087]MBI0119226.1 acetate kinase [Lactobacillus sp. W8089]MBI0131191.1 acetate kinase [Lactobacillus sp. W8090]
MYIMAINAGSSSLKWQIYDMPSETRIAKGLIDRLGKEDAIFKAEYDNGKTFKCQEPITTKEKAATLILTRLKSLKIVQRLEDIKGVGHRVVSGGEVFKKSTVITAEVLLQIRNLSELAPLHNNIEAYYASVFAQLLPHATQVAVFDTSFFTSLQPVNYLYPIETKYYSKYGVRKYGAHGTSHRYVASRTAELLQRPLADLNLITLHLGSGASISAIAHGKPVDTSMGFTPLAGIMMGTRSGDIDPSIMPYIMEKEHLHDISEMIAILNKKSGLLGVSGVSNDKRDIDEAAAQGNQQAQLAQEMFVNRIVKYVGSYLALLDDKPDALVFTAGVGENDQPVRQAVCEQLQHLGVKIDPQKNQVKGQEAEISTSDSPIKVFVVPTNEELMIARDTYQLTEPLIKD